MRRPSPRQARTGSSPGSSCDASMSFRSRRRVVLLAAVTTTATCATNRLASSRTAFAWAPASRDGPSRDLTRTRRRYQAGRALLFSSSASSLDDTDGINLLPIEPQPVTEATSTSAMLEGGGLAVMGVNGGLASVEGAGSAEVRPLASLPQMQAMSLDDDDDDAGTWVVTTQKSLETNKGEEDDDETPSPKKKPPPPPPGSRRFVRRKFRSSVSDLLQAALVGVVTGLSVAIFKLSIEAVREISYQQDVLASAEWFRAVIPAMGGGAVGLLLLLDKSRGFPPGLRGVVKIVDDDQVSPDPPSRDWRAQIQTQIGAVRKSVAAVFTLGSGCSLGPEGPCVEIGLSIARSCVDVVGRRRRAGGNWNLILLSCGAAAGVAAGFNAPIAGVFFALEVVQSAWVSIREERRSDAEDRADNAALVAATDAASVPGDKENQAFGGLMSSTSTIAPVLLASIISALIARTLLGNHLVLVLTEYSLKTPLLELPLYLGLGAVSGAIAFLFSQLAKLSNALFAGRVGPTTLRNALHALPLPVKPVIGGILCGVVGIYFPQILFFGYETLNALLANSALSTSLVLSLLLVKMVMTALSAGSGLVGGTFAPSLFLGAMTGAAYHNIMSSVVVLAAQVGIFQGLSPELADIPAYAMVGAASVLAALFRAPLTASLLLFELTRDYDVILPLMASAGVASLVGDILDDKLEQSRLHLVPRDQDHVSWGDLADKEVEVENEVEENENGDVL